MSVLNYGFLHENIPWIRAHRHTKAVRLRRSSLSLGLLIQGNENVAFNSLILCLWKTGRQLCANSGLFRTFGFHSILVGLWTHISWSNWNRSEC